MKFKVLAAAFAAAFSTLASAVVLPPATTVVAAGDTLYISGASAQKNALKDVLTAAGSPIFATPSDVVIISGPGGSVGYLGTSVAALGSVPYLVIYNSTNGSAAGLNQLLSSGTLEAEATVLKLDATCSTPVGAVNPTSTCGSSQVLETDMALSDVYKSEFGSSGSLCSVVGVGCPGPAYLPLAGIKNAGPTTTGLEGFGVIVNGKMYDALLAQNIADGILDAACAGSTSATLPSPALPTYVNKCQPSIRSRDYAALATKASGVDAAFVLRGQPFQVISLARRDELSGSQAASNILFLDNVCGKAGYGGAITPARAADSVAGSITITEETGTGAVETTVSGAAGYGIGWVSLGEKDPLDSAAAKKFWFVKLDGQSPNYLPSGLIDPTHRQNIATGSYGFVTEMAAYVRTTVAGKAATATAAIAGSLGSSALPTKLVGIAYLDNPVAYPDSIQAAYSRKGNNCAPLQ